MSIFGGIFGGGGGSGGGGAGNYKGTWDADTNTPDLNALSPADGDYYYVAVAGTQDLGNGPTTFAVGDLVRYPDAATGWIKQDHTPTSNEVGNDSTEVAGANVTEALDNLNDDIITASDEIDSAPTPHVHVDTQGFNITRENYQTTFSTGKYVTQNAAEPDITNFVFILDFKAVFGNGGRVLSQRVDSISNFWSIAIDANANGLQILSGGSNKVTNQRFDDGKWHTLAILINSSQVYVDGILRGTANTSFSTNYNVPIQIAAFDNVLSWNGDLREYRIFTGAGVTGTDISNYGSGSDILNNGTLIYKDIGSDGGTDGTRTYVPTGSPPSKSTDSLALIPELELTLTLSGAATYDITALAGYISTAINIVVNIVGTLTQDITIQAPPVSELVRYLTIIDQDGQGVTSPTDFEMLIIPAGADSITSSDGILINEYDLDQPYEAATFRSKFSITKWEAI